MNPTITAREERLYALLSCFDGITDCTVTNNEYGIPGTEQLQNIRVLINDRLPVADRMKLQRNTYMFLRRFFPEDDFAICPTIEQTRNGLVLEFANMKDLNATIDRLEQTAPEARAQMFKEITTQRKGFLSL